MLATKAAAVHERLQLSSERNFMFCSSFCIHVSSTRFHGPACTHIFGCTDGHDNRGWHLASGQKESLPSSRSCAIGDMFSWRDLTWKPSMFGDSTCPCLFCMSLTQGEVSPATARGQPGCSELEPSRRMVRETRPAKQLRPLMHWSGHGTWPCFRFVRELTVAQFLYRLQQQCWAPESDNCVRDKYMSASIPLPCVMDFHTL